MPGSDPVPVNRLWYLHGSAVDLVASGEFDLADAPRLDRALRDAQDETGRVTLDLRSLTFMDCAILSVLLGAAARARRGGEHFLLISGAARVDRLLALTATERQFEIARPEAA